MVILNICGIFLMLFSMRANSQESFLPPEVNASFENNTNLEPRPLTRIVNASEAKELQQETTANASISLSNTSLADIESDNLTQILQLRYRERKRQERLLVIQAQILQRLRLSRQPNITGASLFTEEEQRRIVALVEKMHHVNNHQIGVSDARKRLQGMAHHLHTIQRLQSFYPSCSLPNNTDRSVWEHSESFHVYYDIPLHRYSLDTEIAVMRAKLRIYRTNYNQVREWESDIESLQHYNLIDSLNDYRRADPAIVVSVYQYLKPLRFNRKERKRLVDSKTFPLFQEGWIELNVISSLNHWLRQRHPNFGFDIQVTDNQGNRLNPNLYFRNFNCSTDDTTTQDPPFPNIIELHPEMGENESSLFDNETYPTLDLQTADLGSYDGPLRLQGLASPAFTDRRTLRKRHTLQTKQRGPPCHKETIDLTFLDVGLDALIFFPEKFQWTFCSGHCHYSESQQLVTNELIQTLASVLRKKLLQHSRDNMVSECISTNYISLPVLYNNTAGELTEGILNDFLPSDCMCYPV